MKTFYPKLIAGIALFVVIGSLAGVAAGAFMFIATLPMVALFPEPSSAPQVAIILAALVGFAVACVVIALGTGAWNRRVQTDLYREHAPQYVPSPPPRPIRHDAPPPARHINQR